MTKKYKVGKTITGMLSFLLVVGPLIFFSVLAFTQGEPKEKFCLSASLLAALILAFCNIFAKLKLKSMIWIVLLGINACLNDLTIIILVFAFTSLVDEIIVTPLHKYYSQKYSINKEIDKRL